MCSKIKDCPEARIRQFNLFLDDLLKDLIKIDNLHNELIGLISTCKEKVKNPKWLAAIGLFVDNIINNDEFSNAIQTKNIKYFKQYDITKLDSHTRDIISLILEVINMNISNKEMDNIFSKVDTLRKIAKKYVEVGGR
jgi:hypothetical protein